MVPVEDLTLVSIKYLLKISPLNVGPVKDLTLVPVEVLTTNLIQDLLGKDLTLLVPLKDHIRISLWFLPKIC